MITWGMRDKLYAAVAELERQADAAREAAPGAITQAWSDLWDLSAGTAVAAAESLSQIAINARRDVDRMVADPAKTDADAGRWLEATTGTRYTPGTIDAAASTAIEVKRTAELNSPAYQIAGTLRDTVTTVVERVKDVGAWAKWVIPLALVAAVAWKGPALVKALGRKG